MFELLKKIFQKKHFLSNVSDSDTDVSDKTYQVATDRKFRIKRIVVQNFEEIPEPDVELPSGTEFLFHFDDNITDSSDNAHATTQLVAMGYVQGVFGKSRYSGAFKLDSSDTINLSGDFYIGFWGHSLTQNGYPVLIKGATIGASDWSIQISGGLIFHKANGSQIIKIDYSSGSQGGAIATSDWNHFAFSRSGNTFYGFVNGVVRVSVSDSSDLSAQTVGYDIHVFGNAASYLGIDRKLDELIMIRGSAYRTTHFTPERAAFGSQGWSTPYPEFHLNFNDNVNDQMGNYATTGTSISYDATGKFGKSISAGYVVINNTSALELDNFSGELWAANINGYAGVLMGRGTSGGKDFVFRTDASNNLILEDANAVTLTATGVVKTDANFHHYAFCKSGRVCALFVDGLLVAETRAYMSFPSSSGVDMSIRAYSDGSSNYAGGGEIDNAVFFLDRELRRVEFNPPTTPYIDTNVADSVKFLLHFDDSHTDALGNYITQDLSMSYSSSGKFSSCRSAGRIRVLSSSAINTANEWSISFWGKDLYSKVSGSTAAIFSKGSFFINIDDTSTTRPDCISINKTNANHYDVVPNDSLWHHYVIHFCNITNLTTIFVDGVLLASSTGACTSDTSNDIYLFGTSAGANILPTDALIDELIFSQGNFQGYLPSFHEPVEDYGEGVDVPTKVELKLRKSGGVFETLKSVSLSSYDKVLFTSEIPDAQTIDTTQRNEPLSPNVEFHEDDEIKVEVDAGQCDIEINGNLYYE